MLGTRQTTPKVNNVLSCSKQFGQKLTNCNEQDSAVQSLVTPIKNLVGVNVRKLELTSIIAWSKLSILVEFSISHHLHH